VDAASSDFEITDAAGGTVVAVATAGDVYTFALFDVSTAAGVWQAGQWTLGSTGAPPATIFPTTLGGTGFPQEAWRFDFIADTWAQGSGTSTAVFSNAAGARINGTGFASDTAQNHEQYDPQTWTAKQDQTSGRITIPGIELALGNDRAYYFGSNRTDTGNQDRVDFYDLGDDAFTAATDLPANRHKSNGARSGTDFFIVGGATGVAINHNATVDCIEYDQVADSYDTKASMTKERLDHGCTVDHVGDVVVYCGAEDNNGPNTATVEVYDVSGDSWSSMGDHPNGTSTKLGATHVGANNRNYVVGGEGGTNADATYEHITLTDSYNSKLDHGATSSLAHGIHTTTLSLTD
jgi:hypothetical protein